jgi:predicted DNA-binding transcriptional regulator
MAELGYGRLWPMHNCFSCSYYNLPSNICESYQKTITMANVGKMPRNPSKKNRCYRWTTKKPTRKRFLKNSKRILTNYWFRKLYRYMDFYDKTHMKRKEIRTVLGMSNSNSIIILKMLVARGMLNYDLVFSAKKTWVRYYHITEKYLAIMHIKEEDWRNPIPEEVLSL